MIDELKEMKEELAVVEIDLQKAEKEMHGWAASLYRCDDGDDDFEYYQQKVIETHKDYKDIRTGYSELKRQIREKENEIRMGR